ncbi:hypothetical protein V1460_33510 [Streptomyces sp. SCSIO 30461]|uniref:hypothetical protein n=1 Tax=Streptomyces sp. SCSIO 30461 TaxID=3118085 RepID=UPI0030CE1926
MTNTDTNSANATTTAATATATSATVAGTATATGSLLEAALDTAAPHVKGLRKGKDPKKKAAQRRAAKALAYFTLASTALMVLAEPWLLIPVATLVLAISLWD